MSYTRRLHDLPPPGQLYSRARALAVVELAITARPSMRWHTLDPNVERNVRISSGSDDEASVWLTDAGCVVRGFDHESDRLEDFNRRIQEVRKPIPDPFEDTD